MLDGNKNPPLLLRKDMMFSQKGISIWLVIFYSCFLIISFLVTGDFLAGFTALGVSGWVGTAVAWMSAIAGLCSFGWVADALLRPRKKLSKPRISGEQLAFFLYAGLVFYILGSDDFGYVLLVTVPLFVTLIVSRWE